MYSNVKATAFTIRVTKVSSENASSSQSVWKICGDQNVICFLNDDLLFILMMYTLFQPVSDELNRHARIQIEEDAEWQSLSQSQQERH